MPHAQRKRSESGFYHAIGKGDGGQVIFENEGDRLRYLKELEKAVDDWNMEVHAYCLMSNHVHLLVHDTKNNLSEFMKQLQENYARYFARRTGRVGHVFQGRFWSEPVDKDEYYLSALRYIHANPEPPAICKAKDYPWSSYGAYIKDESFVETSLALSLLGGETGFEKFHEHGSKFAKPYPSSSLTRHLSPDELANVAIAVLGREQLYAIRTLAPKERISHLRQLRDAGMTIGEIARVTGLGKDSIGRLLK